MVYLAKILHESGGNAQCVAQIFRRLAQIAHSRAILRSSIRFTFHVVIVSGHAGAMQKYFLAAHVIEFEKILLYEKKDF